jgi:predicted RNA-binding protein with PUA-like domain
MAFLLKTEPDVYSIADLKRDGETVWDGVRNPQAVLHLRGMKKGDGLVIYHTGDERAAAGTASVVAVDATDPKLPLVRIKYGTTLKTPRTLAEIKANPLFADSPLIKIGRLGVVPLTPEQHAWILGK